MKKVYFVTLALLMALSATAQEKEGLKPGFVHSVGVGVDYCEARVESVDVIPELGFGYRINPRNTVGMTIQYNIRSSMANVFLTHTYDFMDTMSSPFIEYELGVASVLRGPACHVGLEAGYRIALARKFPLRIGLSMDMNGRLISGGAVLRFEW